MTEPRDPPDDSQLPSSGTGAPDDRAAPDDNRVPDDDLAASEQLDIWLTGTRSDAPRAGAMLPTGRAGAMLPTGRAGAMFEVRDALRSRHDVATPAELEDMLTGAMRRLDHEAPAGPEARPLHGDAKSRSRRRAERLKWITAAAAAIVLLAGIGTLLAQRTSLEEVADDSGSSAAATADAPPSDDSASDNSASDNSAQAESGGAAGSGGPTTVPQAPPAPGQGDAQEDFAAESGSREENETNEPSRSGEPVPDAPVASGEDGQDAGNPETAAGAQGSVFAGVRATGKIELR